jgi:hypothetical protein
MAECEWRWVAVDEVPSVPHRFIADMRLAVLGHYPSLSLPCESLATVPVTPWYSITSTVGILVKETPNAHLVEP